MSEIIDLTTGKPSGSQQGSSDALKEIIDTANSKKQFHAGKYENYKCSCGNEFFTTAVVIKKVPAIDLGEISNDIVPLPIEQIPVWICPKCGEIAPFIKNDPDSMKIINKLLKRANTEKEETT